MFSNVLIKPIGLLLENIIQNKIGQESFGAYASLNALAFIFSIMLDLGMNTYLIRSTQNENKSSQENLFAFAFTLKSILAVIFPFLMLIIGFLLSYNITQLLLLFIISLSYSFFSGIQFLRSKLQVNHLLNMDAFASIVDRLLFVIMAAIVLMFYKIDIHSFVYTKLISMSFALILLFYLAYKYLPKAYFKFTFDFTQKKALIKKSFPYALLTILMSIHDKVDQIMIERMVGSFESGIYAAAYRWLDAFMVYLWVLLPIFYTKFCLYIEDKVELQKNFLFGQCIVFIPMIWIVMWSQFYGQYLFFLFDNATHLEIEYMTSVLSLLMMVLMIYSITTIFGTMLTALAKEKYLLIISTIGIILNIGLNLILIPIFQSKGAAIATIVSSLVVGVVHIFQLYKSKAVKINYPLLFHFMIQLIAAWLCFYFTFTYHVSLVMVFVFAFLFFALVSWSTGLYGFIRKQL